MIFLLIVLGYESVFELNCKCDTEMCIKNDIIPETAIVSSFSYRYLWLIIYVFNIL